MMQHGLHRPETMSLDREMKLIFQYFDVDNSGYITADKISQTMKKFLSIIPSENETKSMIHLVDYDKDGRISFAEFTSFYSECMQFTLPRVQEVEDECEDDDIFGKVVNEEHYVHYSGHGIVTQKEKYFEPKLKETLQKKEDEPELSMSQVVVKELPQVEENISKEATFTDELTPIVTFKIPTAPPLPPPTAPPLPKFYGKVQIKKLQFEKKKFNEPEIKIIEKNLNNEIIEPPTPVQQISLKTEKEEIKETENEVEKSIPEEIKRLKGYFLEDIGEVRFYRGSSEPVPFYIQRFCNSFIGKEDYNFESKEHDLENVQFGQEFALENFDEYQHLKEDDILIGDGDCLVVANMNDKQEDFDVYLVEDEESPASGPFKISQFLKTLSITYIPEEEEEVKESGPPPPLYLLKSSHQQTILPVFLLNFK
jgi:hypothetical protein